MKTGKRKLKNKILRFFISLTMLIFAFLLPVNSFASDIVYKDFSTQFGKVPVYNAILNFEGADFGDYSFSYMHPSNNPQTLAFNFKVTGSDSLIASVKKTRVSLFYEDSLSFFENYYYRISFLVRVIANDSSKDRFPIEYFNSFKLYFVNNSDGSSSTSFTPTVSSSGAGYRLTFDIMVSKDNFNSLALISNGNDTFAVFDSVLLTSDYSFDSLHDTSSFTFQQMSCERVGMVDLILEHAEERYNGDVKQAIDDYLVNSEEIEQYIDENEVISAFDVFVGDNSPWSSLLGGVEVAGEFLQFMYDEIITYHLVIPCLICFSALGLILGLVTNGKG